MIPSLAFPAKPPAPPAAALRWLVPAVAVAAAVATVLLGRACFPTLAFDPDSAAYLFQAKLLAEGRIAAPAPPEFGFSPSPHIDIYRGLWFAKYPFGNALMLAPGVLAGAPWLMPAIATGLTLLLFFGIVRTLYDDRVAALALLLAVLSPTTLPMGATLLSQPASRLCIAAFLWAILRMLRAPPGLGRQLWAALAGLALGYGFNTRPLVAIVFGVLGAGLALAVLARRPDRAGFVRPALWAAVPWLLMLGLYLAWNAALTGDPLLSPYHALQQADRMGFGLRGEGYTPFVRDFRIRFTPGHAFARIWLHTLPCVLFNTLGWGAYDPSMLFPNVPEHRFPVLAPLLLLPLGLILLPFAGRRRRPADLFCGLAFLTTLASLLFQYSDHASWGSTPVHCSYYSEAILFGLIPLIARGILILHAAAARRLGQAGPWAFAVAGALLLANTLHGDARLVRWLRWWDPAYQVLPGLVAEARLHHAVVFVAHTRNAPLGAYPFVPLDQADIVYFRTGPLPAWGLNNPDWRLPYRQYFAGRAAYLYDKGVLRPLDTAAATRPLR